MAMTHLQKLRKLLDSRWVSLNPSNHFSSSRTVLYLSSSRGHFLQNCRFYSKRKANDLDEKPQVPTYVKEAQSAMLDYLHSTRSLQFLDAEHMSKNSPLFLKKLLSRMDNKVDIRRSLTRFLRFHPINEFEPLFESMGLKPKEYSAYLPRQLIFLNDDPVFMKNYHVLCNYGIGRGKMGRIHMEAREAFRYYEGVLQSKLMSFGEVGLNQSMVTKLVISCPNVLIESANKDFLELVNKLRGIGIAYDWIEPCIVKEHSCKWHNMLGLVCLLRNMGCSEEQLQSLIRKHPELLCKNSARTTFSIISLLTKFGSTSEGICAMLLQFPQISASRFLANLRSCYGFLLAIEMDPLNIGNIVSSHTLLLGSCPVKKYTSVMRNMGAGKKKMRELIKQNPKVLKSWVYGTKIERISNEEELKSYNMKIKFLLNLGFVENSEEFNKAIKMFRGRGMEFQERFDCFVQAGLNPEDVKRMVKSCPQILNQSQDCITTKIDSLVNDMGYPLSTLLIFPTYISYTVQRTKLRISMYNWLKEEGVVDGKAALSTIVICSDARFMKTYVNSHPKGPEFLENLKKQIYPD